jgi:hypothetical protein
LGTLNGTIATFTFIPFEGLGKISNRVLNNLDVISCELKFESH